MRSMRLPLLLCAALSAAAPALAADHTLDLVDRIGKFQTFYAEATARPLAPDARFALWQKDYGIAAVPPGPDGDAMARQLVDAAWDKYPALIPQLPALLQADKGYAREAFDRVIAVNFRGAYLTCLAFTARQRKLILRIL